MERVKKLDAIKGILIILVVVAHYQRGLFHDVTFLFHMPLFFVMSGCFFRENTEFGLPYIRKCANRYLIPYITYVVCVLMFLDRDFSFSHLIHLAYGGRAIAGTYWYMTCLVFALFLFTFIRSKFSEKSAKCLILVGGGY